MYKKTDTGTDVQYSYTWEKNSDTLTFSRGSTITVYTSDTF